MTVTNKWLEYVTESLLKGVDPTPSVFYLGLGVSSFTVDANDAAVGEITGTGYSRQPISWTDYLAPMTNSAAITFQVGGAWSSVGAAFVSNASQGGEVLLYDTFAAIPVTPGDSLKLDVGDLVLGPA